MNQEQSNVLMSIIREKKDRNGNTYFIGDFNGLLTMSLFKKKGSEDEWIVRLTQKEKRENQQRPNTPRDDFDFG